MINSILQCPDCGSSCLYGPASDYWGICCVDCGYEIQLFQEKQMKPIFTVGKDFSFEAAHSLPHLPEGHKCRNLHGHSYKFRVEIEGPLDDRGFVIDYAEISAAVDPIVEELDHKNLNDLFKEPTTAENLALWLFDQVSERIGSCKRIVFWETPKTMVVFSGKYD